MAPMTDPQPLGHIRLAKPLMDGDELAEVEKVLKSGYLTQGPKVVELEGLVADLVGTRHAFAMTSATTALHLSLVALGVGPGDEVIVPDFTFPATANVVVQQGARPVLTDIDSATFTMSPDDIARRITAQTKAIMPVHAFGLVADMDPINAVAAEHGLPVVEDAACAIGSTYHGRPAGRLGILGCFSFHPRKAITTGEGGMITTDDEALADRIRLLRSHGGVREHGRFTFEDAGFNYRLSDILAAVGVAQFRKLSGIVETKRSLAARYATLLAAVEGVRPPVEPSWGGHVYQSYVVMLDDDVDRDAVIEQMRLADIETTLGTYALHQQPYFRRELGDLDGRLPVSAAAFTQSLCLPLFPGLTDDDQTRIADSLAKAVATSRR
jgi:dTDP-4-amino-4,6-dideoxygalactose transaminase